MKCIVYGTTTCKDCVDALEALDSRSVQFKFLEFSDSINNLKRFLKIRDTHPMFEPVRKQGSVGVPLFVFEDGSMTFSLDEALRKASE